MIKEILSKLNKEKNKKLDEEISKINDYQTFQWEPKSENIKFKNSDIKVNKDFIILSEKLLMNLKRILILIKI